MCARMKPRGRWARRGPRLGVSPAAWCSPTSGVAVWPPAAAANERRFSASPSSVYFIEMAVWGTLWTKWLSETSPPFVIWWVNLHVVIDWFAATVLNGDVCGWVASHLRPDWDSSQEDARGVHGGAGGFFKHLWVLLFTQATDTRPACSHRVG